MSYFKKYPIAFDIGFHDIHALQLEKKADSFRVRAMFHQKLERALVDIKQSRQDLLKTLKTIKKNAGFKSNRAVIHFPAHKVLSFPVEFEVKKNETLDDAIIREVEQNLPYPVKDAVIDYPSITKSKKNNLQKVIIISVKRSDIEELLSVFKKAGFEADAVDFRPISSIRLHQYLFDVSSRPSVICYIGSKESSVQIFNNKGILAMNKFSWGMNQVITKLNVNLGFKETKTNALNLLRQHGINLTSSYSQGSKTAQPPDDPHAGKTGRIVSRIITPSIEELVFEFHKILGYIRNKEDIHEINDISLYGSALMIKGLDQYIQIRMNIPTTTVNLMDQIDTRKNLLTDVSNDITPFAAALGLAMREIPWL